MSNAPDIGVNCLLKIGGSQVVPAQLTGCSPDVNLATRPIILALGLSNALAGYAPSSSAKSGFSVNFDIPALITGATGTFLNAALASAGVTVALQFGTAGGVSVPTCIARSFTVTGSEGGNLSCRIAYDSVGFPTVGATVTPPSIMDVFKFNDVTSVTAISTTVYTDVNNFSFNVMRNLVAYRGNSATGVPKRLKVSHTECTVQAEYLKNGDGEGTIFLGGGTPDYCQTPANVTISIAQACPVGGGTAATLVLLASNCFYDSYPTVSSANEAWVTEKISAKATSTASVAGGAFTIT